MWQSECFISRAEGVRMSMFKRNWALGDLHFVSLVENVA